MTWLSPRGKNAFRRFNFNSPCDSSHKLKFGDFSLGSRLKSDPDFIANFTEYKSKTMSRLNLTIETINRLKKKLKLYYWTADRQLLKPFFLIKFLLQRPVTIRYELDHRVAMRHIISTYLNSLKFLRHYWYQFEADTAIQ